MSAGPDRLGRCLVAVSGLTAASGLAQLVAPGAVLRALRAESSPTTRQGFATVGMFMAVVGGGTLQALVTTPPAQAAPWVLWTGVQKLGAALAVASGVRRGVFGRAALLVAANDLGSGILALRWCAARERRP